MAHVAVSITLLHGGVGERPDEFPPPISPAMPAPVTGIERGATRQPLRDAVYHSNDAFEDAERVQNPLAPVPHNPRTPPRTARPRSSVMEQIIDPNQDRGLADLGVVEHGVDGSIVPGCGRTPSDEKVSRGRLQASPMLVRWPFPAY